MAFLPLGIRSPRERVRWRESAWRKASGYRGKRNRPEFKGTGADAVKLAKEAERLGLSYTFDKVKLVLTAIAAGTTVLVAVEPIGGA